MNATFLANDMLNDPLALFLAGLGLLILFIWYFASDSERMKRLLGTILVLGVVALSLLALIPPSKTLKGGIDIVGGSAFTLEVQPNVNPNTNEVIPLTREAVDQAIEVIEKRLSQGGTRDMLIARSGDDKIIVQMPGMAPEQADEVREQLQKVAKLELRAVNMRGFERGPGGGPSLAERVYNQEEVAPGYKGYKHDYENEDGQLVTEYLLLDRRPAVTGGDVADAYPQMQGADNIVGVELTSEGAEKMFRLTSEMQKQVDRLAVLLDDEVVTAPVVNDTLRQRFVITGQNSLEEARTLANQLLNPLENPLKIDEERTVSPTLGEAVVKQGVISALVGLAFTAIFIFIYYRTVGIIALIALAVNAVIIFGAMAMLGFTFTLPGIAGIILTIGMAVDANVLIYERLREEINHGKSIQTAINTAYDKAFSAIFDSNITSLITATILFWKASSTVQGFAVTLTIGLLGSMFSAILVTRVMFRWAIQFKALRNVSLLNLFQSTQFDFLGKARVALFVSIALLVAAVAGFAIRGQQGLGVDFTGGTLLQFQLGDDVISASDVENELKDLDTVSRPIVQEETVPGTGELLSIRAASEDAEAIETELRESFPDILGQRVPVVDEAGRDTGRTQWAVQATTDAVSATAGQAFLVNSCVALAIGLVAILIYISIRFEFSFALGAFVAVVHDVVLATGLVVLLGGELSLIHVGAILTIAGYSINDTIIVFDRIRESLMTQRGQVKDLMNQAINATLSRTLLTSLTTIFTVTILAIFGGAALRAFSVMILIGLIIGTYSSIFVASPVVLWWSKRKGQSLRREVLDANLAGETAANA